MTSRNAQRGPTDQSTDASAQPNSGRAPPEDTHRFSFTPDSPLERPVYHQFQSPTNSSIDESPVSPSPRWEIPQPQPREAQAQFPDEKRRLQDGESQSHAPPVQMHPAHFAPYADPRPSQPPSSSIPLSPVSPRPLPPYSDRPNDPPKQSQGQALDQEQNIPKPLMNPRTPTYNPHSLTGPNADLQNHKPGQVAHPNSAVKPEWESGLCSVDGTCCLSLFAPCVVYGRVQYRLNQKAKKKEATDLLGFGSVNHSCALMAISLCFSGVLAAIQRTRIRKLYKIDGGVGDDCLKACCCCCCAIAQDEREVKIREERLRRYAGPTTYTTQPAMTYPPPPR